MIFYLNPFWQIKVKGRHYLDKKKTYIIVANHISAADIPALSFLKVPFRWVSKTSVFFYPLMGWQMWLIGHLGIRRGHPKSIARFKERAKKTLDKGLSILIFPEGTNSPSGKLLPFKTGGFRLAIENNIPILPVVIHGTERAMPSGIWLFKSRVQIFIQVLPEIKPNRFKDVYTLKEATRELMKSKKQELEEIFL
jgi:1-acyl-sn-glycerol-3-phosphate acyltransferase